MSINPSDFFRLICDNGIDFFAGVPDSLLKQFCLCIDDNVPSERHVITANEGNAIALASGYYLGTGQPALVYMQNSGLGNAVNPLLSLADPEVYSFPMLIMIGWRGHPGFPDEPQHIKQGKVQIDILNAIDIPFEVLSGTDDDWQNKILYGINTAKTDNRPFAIVVKKGTFGEYDKGKDMPDMDLLLREEALQILFGHLADDILIVSTTGKTSREIFEIRVQNGQSHSTDFLTVGSMGHCSSIALGLALAQSDKKVLCIDGDGSMLMHMGSLPVIGKAHPQNFYHVLLNNFVHESVSDQKTAIDVVDIPNLIRAVNYKNIYTARNRSEMKSNVNRFLNSSGPAFLEIQIKSGSRSDLGRPTIKPVDNKIALMDLLKNI